MRLACRWRQPHTTHAIRDALFVGPHQVCETTPGAPDIEQAGRSEEARPTIANHLARHLVVVTLLEVCNIPGLIDESMQMFDKVLENELGASRAI